MFNAITLYYENCNIHTITFILQDEKYNHIEKADIDKIEKVLTEKSNWFMPRMTQMAQLQPHQNPPVLASQVRSEKQVRFLIKEKTDDY